jgi:hypothetical protein
MDVDITRFVRANRGDMDRYSDSIGRSGLQDIGRITWRNALDAMASESDWLTTDLDALRNHFADYGAWEREELAAMSGTELNALLVQFVAGDWQEREDARERGRAELRAWEEGFGGRLTGGRGRWYYYVGT